MVLDLGFTWKKTDKSGVLIERHNRNSPHVFYLTALWKYQMDGWPIVNERIIIQDNDITRSSSRSGDWSENSENEGSFEVEAFLEAAQLKQHGQAAS
jgi:hypothetical protein